MQGAAPEDLDGRMVWFLADVGQRADEADRPEERILRWRDYGQMWLKWRSQTERRAPADTEEDLLHAAVAMPG